MTRLPSVQFKNWNLHKVGDPKDSYFTLSLSSLEIGVLQGCIAIGAIGSQGMINEDIVKSARVFERMLDSSRTYNTLIGLKNKSIITINKKVVAIPSKSWCLSKSSKQTLITFRIRPVYSSLVDMVAEAVPEASKC